MDILKDVDHPSLDWHVKAHIANDAAKGMTYLHLHDPPILHCDLKSSNVCVSLEWIGKICDFGLTKLYDASEQEGRRVGTALWMVSVCMGD